MTARMKPDRVDSIGAISGMAQVNVTISGRVYRMACEDGEEEHLHRLADKLDSTIGSLRETFGEIGDQRLTVMAAIMAMDELAEARLKIADLESENRLFRDAAASRLEEQSASEAGIARRIDEAADRIEQLAAALVKTKPSG